MKKVNLFVSFIVVEAKGGVSYRHAVVESKPLKEMSKEDIDNLRDFLAEEEQGVVIQNLIELGEVNDL